MQANKQQEQDSIAAEVRTEESKFSLGAWIRKNRDYILISLGIALIIILPYVILLQQFEGEFTESAARVGTAIGGMTFPLVSILIIIFLFIIMREQMKFNKRMVQRDNDSNDYALLFSLQDQIKEQVASLTFTYGGKTLEGKAVLNIFANTNENSVITLNDSDSELYDRIMVIATLGNALLKRNFESNIPVESKYIFFNNTCDTLDIIKSAYVRYYANIEQKSLFDHITKMLVFMPSYKTIKSSEVAINYAMHEYNIDLRSKIIAK